MQNKVWIKKIGLLLGVNLLITHPLFSAIYCEIDTTQPLKCVFSSRHPNRILVDKQSVEKIIHSEPEAIQVLIEEKANQAFVMACAEIENPITLCVVTSSGEVQDIEVSFEDQPSQLVILQEKKIMVKSDNLPIEPCQMQTTIRSILAHEVPTGSTVLNFYTDPSYLRKKVKIIEISRFDREFEVIRVFKISNCSKQKQIVQEKELTMENASWIFLEKNILLAHESIIAIVAMNKEFDQ